jgi:hypothetical protein
MPYPISTYGSDAIDTLSVNPITGTVRVRFQKYYGVQYRFKAPRAACLALICNSDCSLGQWVNRHCLPNARPL